MSAPDTREPEPTDASPTDPALVSAPDTMVDLKVPTAAVDPVLEPPMPSGAPYRMPAPIEGPLWVPVARAPRPIIGPALSVFGALLWAFVVFGTFTTSWMFGAPLNQAMAVFAVFATTVVAWFLGVRRSHVVVPARSPFRLFGRAVAIALLAGGLFLAAILFGMIAGSLGSHGHDFAFGFLMVLVALAASMGGRRLLSPVTVETTHRQRSVRLAIWLAGGLATLLAGIDLASNS